MHEGGERPRREDREDRTALDWRSAPREEAPRETRDSRQISRDLPSRNGGLDQDREPYRGRNSYETRTDGGYDRRNQDRFGSKGGSSYGYQGSRDERDGRSNDRGFERRGMDRMERGDRYQNNDMKRRDFSYGFDKPQHDPLPSQRRSESPESHHSPPPSEKPAERKKLQLKPRSKPIAAPDEPMAASKIFGGAKPVNTAAREKEIEERLLKEREETDKKEIDRAVSPIGSERVRRVSATSSVSNTSRSRRGSESGPPISVSSFREDRNEYRGPRGGGGPGSGGSGGSRSDYDDRNYNTYPRGSSNRSARNDTDRGYDSGTQMRKKGSASGPMPVQQPNRNQIYKRGMGLSRQSSNGTTVGRNNKPLRERTDRPPPPRFTRNNNEEAPVPVSDN